LLRSSLQLTDDVPLDDAVELSAVPGWDSFAHVRLVIELEALLDRRLDMDEIVALTSIGDIRTLLNGNSAKSN